MAQPGRRLLVTLLMTTLGNVCYALSAQLFLLPSGLPTGGTTGIALAVNALTGMPVSAFVLVFNVAMLLLGLMVMGRQFAATTVLSSFLYPIALEVFGRLLGDVVLTENLMLNTVFYGAGVGLSLGMVIRAGASTGGMDIPPLVLNRLMSIPVSVSLYVFDVLILLLQAVYLPAEKVLYGILLVMIYSIVLDKVMLLGTSRTEIKVVSAKAEEIRGAILEQMDRGVTMLDGEGGYARQPLQMILSVVSNRELPRLERIIHGIDPESFMVVSRVSEVRGRGFTLSKRYPN